MIEETRHKTSRLYFSKYLTQNKKDELNKFLAERVHLLSFLSRNLSVEALSCKVTPVLHTEGINGMALDLLYSSYMKEFEEDKFNRLSKNKNIRKCDLSSTQNASRVLLSRSMFYLVLKEYVRAVRHNLYKYGKENYKAPVFNTNQFVFYRTGRYAYESFWSYSHGDSEDMRSFDYYFRIADFSCNPDTTNVVIPLKKHRQFNKLLSKGYLTSKVILTNKYVEFTFERSVRCTSELKSEAITISKNGDLRLEDGEKVKLNLDDKLKSNLTKSQKRVLKSQIKNQILGKLNFDSLGDLTLTYKAVGKYYTQCSFCKGIIKELCRSNRVRFTDSFQPKLNRNKNKKSLQDSKMRSQ